MDKLALDFRLEQYLLDLTKVEIRVKEDMSIPKKQKAFQLRRIEFLRQTALNPLKIILEENIPLPKI